VSVNRSAYDTDEQRAAQHKAKAATNRALNKNPFSN